MLPGKASADKKRGGEYIDWTDARKLALAVAVSACKAYKKDPGDDSYQIKYSNVMKRLNMNPEFVGINLTFPAIQDTFKRFQKTVLMECGVSEEGANLSGKSDPTEYEKLMINMAEDKAKGEHKKKVKAEKDAEIKAGLLTHERTGLMKQARLSYSSASLGASAASPALRSTSIDEVQDNNSLDERSLSSPDDDKNVSDLSSNLSSKKKTGSASVDPLIGNVADIIVDFKTLFEKNKRPRTDDTQAESVELLKTIANGIVALNTKVDNQTEVLSSNSRTMEMIGVAIMRMAEK